MNNILSRKKILISGLVFIVLIGTLTIIYFRFANIYPKNTAKDSGEVPTQNTADVLRSNGLTKLKSGDKDGAMTDLKNAKSEYEKQNNSDKAREVDQQIDYIQSTPLTQTPMESDPKVQEQINTTYAP